MLYKRIFIFLYLLLTVSYCFGESPHMKEWDFNEEEDNFRWVESPHMKEWDSNDEDIKWVEIPHMKEWDSNDEDIKWVENSFMNDWQRETFNDENFREKLDTGGAKNYLFNGMHFPVKQWSSKVYQSNSRHINYCIDKPLLKKYYLEKTDDLIKDIYYVLELYDRHFNITLYEDDKCSLTITTYDSYNKQNMRSRAWFGGRDETPSCKVELNDENTDKKFWKNIIFHELGHCFGITSNSPYYVGIMGVALWEKFSISSEEYNFFASTYGTRNLNPKKDLNDVVYISNHVQMYSANKYLCFKDIFTQSKCHLFYTH